MPTPAPVLVSGGHRGLRCRICWAAAALCATVAAADTDTADALGPAMPAVAVVSAVAEHSATVIWLHGLGEEAKHWSGIAAQSKIRNPHVRWLFPTAKKRVISLHPGSPVPAWFDLRTYQFREDGFGFEDEDAGGLAESTGVLRALVDQEIEQFGIAADRIVVGGFSQGGVVAMDLACVSSDLPTRLAGIVTMGSWIPFEGGCARPTAQASATPALMLHGAQDRLVPSYAVEGAADELAARGMRRLIFRRLANLGHSGSGDVTENVLRFVSEVLRPLGPENIVPSLDAHLPPAHEL